MDSVGSFFNWGMLELRADQMKRTKNSRSMHMLFNVQYGTVEVKVHENEFTVHKGGIWQVPRGMSHFSSSSFHFPCRCTFPRAHYKFLKRHDSIRSPAHSCHLYDSGHFMLGHCWDVACTIRIAVFRVVRSRLQRCTALGTGLSDADVF